ncbi:snRNA-activating protein complex subunit 5-like [Pecten maximus]|uniref:snRNA-activating protein complex subunit 5-like n=1 Tax=Pecten maximus TaxID=6579 RepID=UPI001458D16A|nr:snRNA-activating protein complex subunit 5-like [Pecten maximus]
MAALKELRRLRDEERTLVNIASKVSDQLNRLKVEELALVSMIRQNVNQGQPDVEEELNNKDNSHVPQQIVLKTETNINEENDNKPPELLTLDLSVQPTGQQQFGEEEEEEDDDDDDIVDKLQQ